MSDPFRICEHCRWWDTSAQRANTQPDTTGLCRINPPTQNIVTGGACWPFTADVDWCGAFQADTTTEGE